MALSCSVRTSNQQPDFCSRRLLSRFSHGSHGKGKGHCRGRENRRQSLSQSRTAQRHHLQWLAAVADVVLPDWPLSCSLRLPDLVSVAEKEGPAPASWGTLQRWSAPGDLTAALSGNLVVSTHRPTHAFKSHILRFCGRFLQGPCSDQTATPQPPRLPRWVAPVALKRCGCHRNLHAFVACMRAPVNQASLATHISPPKLFWGMWLAVPVLVGLVTPVPCLVATSYSRRFGQGAGDCFPALGFSIGPSKECVSG
jgi:hypothetical protein